MIEIRRTRLSCVWRGLPFAIARTVTALRAAGPRWGNLAGASTRVRMDEILAPGWTAGFGAIADLRALRLHETRGPVLRLRPVSAPASGAFADGTDALCFYGTATEAQALGLGVNAGHDLSQANLGDFLRGVPNVLEVSIGHALFGEALHQGLGPTVRAYRAIIGAASGGA